MESSEGRWAYLRATWRLATCAKKRPEPVPEAPRVVLTHSRWRRRPLRPLWPAGGIRRVGPQLLKLGAEPADLLCLGRDLINQRLHKLIPNGGELSPRRVGNDRNTRGRLIVGGWSVLIVGGQTSGYTTSESARKSGWRPRFGASAAWPSKSAEAPRPRSRPSLRRSAAVATARPLLAPRGAVAAVAAVALGHRRRSLC